MPLRFVFGLHNHQPVGNFGFVFEQAYRDAYGPFLALMEKYSAVAFSMHISGPLLEWLVEHRPDYVERLRRLTARGQAEIVGGAFYEPILPGIPSRDRIGQICTFSSYLETLFGCRIRGMWLAERVWEQTLVSDLVRSGIEYTLLDDHHFKQAGVDEDRLFGCYLTEDEGRLLKVFPISEMMRYLVPWKPPEQAAEYLHSIASRHPNAVLVCADDGEKFGGWPGTYELCYTRGWLASFLELLLANPDVQFCTLAQALDALPPLGLVYLPDGSYREMNEWALPTERLRAYRRAVRMLETLPEGTAVRRFMDGGTWRNFRSKYVEAREMYARMLEVSEKVRVWEKDRSAGGAAVAPDAHPATELYKAQCNCAYWHGAFGGLYLPHLRHAVYRHLIAAENFIVQATPQTLPRFAAAVADFNLDGRPEICLSNWHLSAYINPHAGGCLYELDLRSICHNLLATLSRRPEPYHDVVIDASVSGDSPEPKGLHEQVRFKEAGLERLLHYDSYSRKSLIDHFYAAEATRADAEWRPAAELGDAATGEYRFELHKDRDAVALRLSRTVAIGSDFVEVTKEIVIRGESEVVEVRYCLDRLPRGPVRFAVEFQFSGLAANADDRYFHYPGHLRAGPLQTRLDLNPQPSFGLIDEWLGLDAQLTFSMPAAIWTFPIETVSLSEGGFERVHQSTAVLTHWLLDGPATGRWTVDIQLRLDTTRAERRMIAPADTGRQ